MYKRLENNQDIQQFLRQQRQELLLPPLPLPPTTQFSDPLIVLNLAETRLFDERQNLMERLITARTQMMNPHDNLFYSHGQASLEQLTTTHRKQNERLLLLQEKEKRLT